ncbi:hypothetical protein [Streptomyces sp. NPDC040750]|uniref:ATP-dependent DNA ligase n=1 Tax=Streptomyces sp. NPDC040750 TaxID=3154491 RepID=UPI0033BFCFAB
MGAGPAGVRAAAAASRPARSICRPGCAGWPAHFVAFDLVHRGDDLTGWPYARRRAALEALFAKRSLTTPWVLCPSTTDPALAREWLWWTAAGVEGLCFKRLEESYRGGARSWRKYKMRVTTEAVISAVTGSLAAPRTLLLGRYDRADRLRYVGRSTTLAGAVGRAVADHLAPSHGAHPWTGWTFSAGWGTQRTLDAVLVQPDVVMEVDVGPRQCRTVAASGPPAPHPRGRRRPGGAAVRRRRRPVMSQGRPVVGSMVGPATAAAVSCRRRSR